MRMTIKCTHSRNDHKIHRETETEIEKQREAETTAALKSGYPQDGEAVMATFPLSSRLQSHNQEKTKHI